MQQQLFTLPERKFNDFVVCAIDSGKNAHLVTERIYPDLEHSKRVLPKLQEFLENLHSPRNPGEMVHKEV